MGDFNIVVNTDLREWLNPEVFDLDPRRMRLVDVDEYGANALCHAICYLCTGGGSEAFKPLLRGRWQGCNVQYLSDESTPSGGVEYGVPLGEHYNLFDLATETYRNISRDVLRDFVQWDPLLLVAMFRKAVRSCEARYRDVTGYTILAMHDEQTPEGEDFRQYVGAAAQRELEWTEAQWEELVARLRNHHAEAAEASARWDREHALKYNLEPRPPSP